MSARPEINTHEDIEGAVESTELVEIPKDAMVESQVATAKRFPRSVSKFRKEALSLACIDEETAGECLFALPRGGKTIEGPSVRFAEILAYSWGNSRAEAMVIEEGATHVKAAGIFYDLERNVAVRKVVARRITNKQGRRYDDDMIGVTGNAASSIAYRNAVFAGIPKALWKAIYAQARLTSLGKAGSFGQTRQKMLDYYAKMGIKAEQLYKLLEVDGLEDVKEDQVIRLRGIANALRDGETTLEEVFNPRATVAGDVGTPNLNDRLKQKAATPAPAPAAAKAATSEQDDLALDQELARQEGKAK